MLLLSAFLGVAVGIFAQALRNYLQRFMRYFRPSSRWPFWSQLREAHRNAMCNYDHYLI